MPDPVASPAQTVTRPLDDVHAARQEALEDGTLEPAPGSIALATSLVPKLHEILPGDYDTAASRQGFVTYSGLVAQIESLELAPPRKEILTVHDLP